MSTARISIIIPFYNSEKYIEKCVTALIEQSYQNIEMIFINDGSTDKGREIVAAYQQKDARIILLDRENSGPAVARNAGLAKATGKYIMFCDSDDFYQPEMVPLWFTSLRKAMILI